VFPFGTPSASCCNRHFLVLGLWLALLNGGVCAQALGHAPALTDLSTPSLRPDLAPQGGSAGDGLEGALVSTHSIAGRVPIRSWKTLRDAHIVKQDLDKSCGAASLATLLNAYFGQNVTEKQLLKAMDTLDGRASFADMAQALRQFGFKAQGFAASWEQLVRLKVPVIVYVKYRTDDHFSVLRGISGDTVWLADPSLGNRTFSRAQFLAMWQTREDKPDSELVGKFLAVLPASDSVRAPEGYFARAPRRQSANAVTLLTFRPVP
jgi:uncharacterized protein